MKWFFAANAESLKNKEFFRLVRVAVASAKLNTDLDIYMMLDGEAEQECDAIRELGAVVVPVSLSFNIELTQWMEEEGYDEVAIRCRRGSYLRMELPVVLREQGINDEYVIYSDVDVFFECNPDFTGLQPRVFAASGKKEGGFTRFKIGCYHHYQAGVLMLNARAMLATYQNFRDFVLSNGSGVRRPKAPFFQKNLFLSDQVALNLFYRKRISKMSKKLNWNPTYGDCQHAEIIHFNGLKWTEWNQFLQNKLSRKRQAKFARQIGGNSEPYRLACEKVLEFEAGLR